MGYKLREGSFRMMMLPADLCILPHLWISSSDTNRKKLNLVTVMMRKRFPYNTLSSGRQGTMKFIKSYHFQIILFMERRLK